MLLEKIEFPETVISMSIEPQSSADRDKLLEALTMLARENPTFEYRANEETGPDADQRHGRAAPGGAGQPAAARHERRRPRWASRGSRIARRSRRWPSCEEEFKRQTGGKGLYAKVKLRVEPYTPSEGEEHVVFENRVSRRGHSAGVPARRSSRRVRGCGQDRRAGGYPMINVKITLLDADRARGRQHRGGVRGGRPDRASTGRPSPPSRP